MLLIRSCIKRTMYSMFHVYIVYQAFASGFYKDVLKSVSICIVGYPGMPVKGLMHVIPYLCVLLEQLTLRMYYA